MSGTAVKSSLLLVPYFPHFSNIFRINPGFSLQLLEFKCLIVNRQIYFFSAKLSYQQNLVLMSIFSKTKFLAKLSSQQN